MKRELPPPAIMTRNQVAARIGRSPEWIRTNLPRLRQLGFPAYDKLLCGWHCKAIERWLDKRAGVQDEGEEILWEEIAIQRIENGFAENKIR